jgi:four helix bundle protein
LGSVPSYGEPPFPCRPTSSRAPSGRPNADYARFLNIAEASLAETEYLLLLASDLGYLRLQDHQPIAAEIDELARMLHALRAKVEQGEG